jgi:hypothetical protein
MQTDEQNTRWVTVWAVNSPDYYDRLQATAAGGPDALRALVEQIWKDAPDGTPEYYQARAMSHDDYDRVDWTEVVTDLIGDTDTDTDEES